MYGVQVDPTYAGWSYKQVSMDLVLNHNCLALGLYRRVALAKCSC